MRFQRTALIERVKAAIEAHEHAVATSNAKEAAEHVKRREDYLAKTSDAWKQLADTIRLRLRTGRPMTAADIPAPLRNGGISYVRTWNDPEPETYTAGTGALKQLLVLLEAATDEEITTSSLERMGFRTAQLFTTR